MIFLLSTLILTSKAKCYIERVCIVYCRRAGCPEIKDRIGEQNMRKYLEKDENGRFMKVFEHICESCGIFFQIKIPNDVLSEEDLDRVLEFDSAWRSHENGNHEYREYSQLITVVR